MPLKLYAASSWRPIKDFWILQGGAWKSVQGGWVWTSGAWRKFYDYAEEHVKANITVAGGTDINLRTEFNIINGSASPAGSNIKFTLVGNAIASSTGAYALQTGSWPEAGVTLTLTINGGVYVVGKGGQGGTCKTCGGGAGGPAIGLSKALTIVNNGTVGGGGGGGGGSYYAQYYSGGGGGAGYGASGGGTCTRGGTGGLANGGAAGYCCLSVRCAQTSIYSGAGGGLGAGGGGGVCSASCRTSGGAGGCAIVANGNAYSLAGDVRGGRC